MSAPRVRVPTRLSFLPSFCERSFMATCPKSRPQNRKRQHAEADLSQDDLPSLPSKKFKSTGEHHSASKFPPPALWDSLSKVWLIHRALRELNRRDQLKGGVCAQALAHKPVRQFSNRKDLQPVARHGGSELCDLRGVRLNYPTTVSIWHLPPYGARSSETEDRKHMTGVCYNYCNGPEFRYPLVNLSRRISWISKWEDIPNLSSSDAVIWRGDLAYLNSAGGGGQFETISSR